MKKVIILFVSFTFISATVYAQKIQPGVIITKENYKEYLPELKKLLPDILYDHYVNGIENGWVTMPIVKKGEYHAPKGYLGWSEKNKGVYKIGKGNKLIGPLQKGWQWPWMGGAPFPDPKNGTELGWNIYYRYSCSREDWQIGNEGLLFDKAGKLERSHYNYFYGKVYNGRVTIPPIPEIPGNKGVIHWKVAMIVTEPFDVKGFIMLRVVYEDVFKNDDVFCYLPAIRRLRRLTGADVTDPLLGTDACYDDFECWQQKLGPRIVFHEPQKREMLVPKQLNLKKYPGKMPEGWVVGNCFQTDWEKRNLWVMSADMNDPNYNYSKRIFYIDSEDKTYFIHGIQNYDQKGKLWKMIEAFGIANQPETWFRSWHGGLYKDHITGHSTLYDMNPLGWELDKVRIPKEYFTVRGLLKLAR